LKPEPRLVPDDPRALEAERWADNVLQQWARRMVASTGSRNPDALAGRGAEGRMGPLLSPYDQPRRVIARLVLVAFRADKEQLRDDRERTGEILDKVDAWIADGVLNGEQLRSPDFAIAPSLALVEYILALQPELRRRPLRGLLERVFSGRDAARGQA
jgi:glutathione S-transferase